MLNTEPGPRPTVNPLEASHVPPSTSTGTEIEVAGLLGAERQAQARQRKAFEVSFEITAICRKEEVYQNCFRAASAACRSKAKMVEKSGEHRFLQLYVDQTSTRCC